MLKIFFIYITPNNQLIVYKWYHLPITAHVPPYFHPSMFPFILILIEARWLG
jgi:hypothetical protein